jgi:hypothetical protein
VLTSSTANSVSQTGSATAKDEDKDHTVAGWWLYAPKLAARRGRASHPCSFDTWQAVSVSVLAMN